MTRWTLSKRAEKDLIELTAYGVETFGEDVADQYAESLRACFGRLVLNPRMGREAGSEGLGLRRIEHRRHVVFYELEPSGGVRIVAVIHERSIRAIKG